MSFRLIFEERRTCGKIFARDFVHFTVVAVLLRWFCICAAGGPLGFKGYSSGGLERDRAGAFRLGHIT